MNELLRVLLGIVRRRLGPQDLPHSPALLRGLLFFAIGLQLVFGWLLRDDVASPARIAFSLLLTVALPWLVLQWRGHGERYVQTLTAIVGTGILFSLAMAPLLFLARDMPLPSDQVPPKPIHALVSLFALGLVAWKIAIDGHIWRHALAWPLVGGVLLALGLFVFELGLEQMVFPAPTPAASTP